VRARFTNGLACLVTGLKEEISSTAASHIDSDEAQAAAYQPSPCRLLLLCGNFLLHRHFRSTDVEYPVQFVKRASELEVNKLHR